MSAAKSKSDGYQPRLKVQYEEFRPRLKEELGLDSIMQVPRITKITLNMGVGEAKTDSKLLDKAEKPTEVLDYSYEKQLELLQNVRRGVADVTTAKKRLQVQTEKLEQEIVKLEGQARQAIGANREDLARKALERKSGIQQELVGLDTQVQQLQAQQDKLVEQQKALTARVEQFRSQKEIIKAQYSAAEASARIGEAATGIGGQMSDMGTALQRAKDKTEEMQARASAMDAGVAVSSTPGG